MIQVDIKSELISKEVVKNQIISNFYFSRKNKIKPIISKKEIKMIEDVYKTIFFGEGRNSNIDNLFSYNSQLMKIFDKLGNSCAIKDYIKKQYKEEKALQPGIIAECCCLQTLAKSLGFNKYINLEETPLSSIPDVFVKHLQLRTGENSKGTLARYGYYKDYNSCLIQYGNPDVADGSILYCDKEILLEIKDLPARLMETDLYYDENGKIIISDNLRENFPEYIKYIEKFNKETSIFEKLGSNYPLFNSIESQKEGHKLLESFFKTTRIDFFLVFTDRELLLIKTEDFLFTFENGSSLFTLDTSEIRTSGKNYVNIFTPIYLKNILEKYKVIYDIVNPDLCMLPKNSDILGLKTGRGQGDKKTRLALNQSFFIKIEDVEETDNYFIFPFKKIKQVKPNISLHINTKKSSKDIVKELYIK